MAGNSAVYRPVFSTTVDLDTGVVSATVKARFAEDATDFNAAESELVQGAIEFNMLKHSPIYRDIVPRGLRFTFNGATYYDRGDGRLYRNLDPLTGAAVDSGSVAYQGGIAQIEEYAAGSSSLSMQAMLVEQGLQGGLYLAFRTPGAPVAVGSLQLNVTAIDGSTITATAENDGTIEADEMTGNINVDTGVVELQFGHVSGSDWVDTPVDLSSIRYNTVIQRYVPLDADRLKLDPTRLPVDGRVPIYLPSQIVVVHSTVEETIADDLEAGQMVQLGRAPINKLWVRDANGQMVPEDRYTADMTLAQITFADPLDLTGYEQPLKVTNRVELMREVTEVQINGLLKLAAPLTANFAASNTYVSTLMEFGDLQARVEHMFTQAVWGNVWADERSGADSVGKFNDVAYPAIVNNLHTITERWAIVFTGTTTFNVLGEFSGIVATGSTGADCSPLNPFTGSPMFTLQHEGWGVGGFVNNNVLRFNTVGAAVPVWLLRAIALGDSDVAQDQGAVEFRTDVD